jgi:hypothetical protein
LEIEPTHPSVNMIWLGAQQIREADRKTRHTIIAQLNNNSLGDNAIYMKSTMEGETCVQSLSVSGRPKKAWEIFIS